MMSIPEMLRTKYILLFLLNRSQSVKNKVKSFAVLDKVGKVIEDRCAYNEEGEVYRSVFSEINTDVFCGRHSAAV